MQDEIKHHAARAREFAQQASESGHAEVTVQKLAQLSTAHSLASIATALGEGYLSAEVELVRFGAEKPAEGSSSTLPAVPVLPAPATPARGVLVPNQRVLCIDTEGHTWPDILKTVSGEPYQGVAGVVVGIDEEADLVKVLVDAPGRPTRRDSGPTIQLHREQLRIPAPPGPPDPPDVPEMHG